MKKNIITLIILCNCFVLNGQTELAEHYNFNDSIQRITQEIESTTDLKVKAERLLDVSYYYSDYNLALIKQIEANEFASQFNDSLLSAEIGLAMAMTNYLLGNYEQSLILYDSIVPLYSILVDERSYYMAVFQYSKALSRGGRYYDALEKSQEAYNFFSALEGEQTYSGLLSQVVASIYRKLGRSQEAIIQYQSSINWCSQDDNPSCECGAFRSISNIYLGLNDLSQARENINLAKEAIADYPALQWHSTYNNLILAKILIAENKSKEALQILNSNFKDVLEDYDPIQIANYHLQFAKAYMLNKEYQKALKHNTSALEIGNDKEAKSITKAAHLTNSLLFEKLGNPSMALKATRNYNAINESILSTEKIAQINELDNKYKSALTKNKLNELEKDNAVKELQLEKGKQRKIYLGLGIGGLLLSLFVVLYYLKRKSNINTILEEKNIIIHKSLKDKDILLREIHHRVKNNLQVVSSLLNLQANYISDELALEAITEGKNRVSSMALIHQNLYQENNLTSINSKEYFDDLIENLFESYNIDEGNIILVKEIDALDIDVDTMIPLGLIVNELVSNSLKHAFKNIQHKGKIIVKLKEDNQTLKLSIADNGIGMSKEHFLSSDSFGNKMIKAFKQKLDADIIVENKHGTTVSINIKNYKLFAA